ncbi:hypothetical protein GOD54_23420 [Sinorhizobium medicae]|nr:hypothetical protein [Sinorhizobium medicae]
MSPHANTQRLKELMSANNLRIADVARILGRSKQTVKEWRCANARTISSNNLKLLEHEIAAREEVAV